MKAFKVPALLLFVVLLSCQGGRLIWPDAEGRLVMPSSPREIAEAHQDLADIDDAHVPKDMQGGLLFDGIVLRRLADDRVGQTVWLIEPVHVYLGRGFEPKAAIVVTSPTVRNGGIMLTAGARVRVFTVEMDHRLYIWNASVLALDSTAAALPGTAAQSR